MPAPLARTSPVLPLGEPSVRQIGSGSLQLTGLASALTMLTAPGPVIGPQSTDRSEAEE
jgi:hypothetical protein